MSFAVLFPMGAAVVFVSTTSIFHIIFSALCVLSTQWCLGAMAPQTRLVPLLRSRFARTDFVLALAQHVFFILTSKKTVKKKH